MPTNSVLRSAAMRHYVMGLAAVAAGGGLSSATGSMLPLALGSAAALMGMAGLVRAIRSAAARDRQRRG
ncbi:MAG: hypothetical protein LH480_00960 [Rubrivivax sp.]|nr:hypothetical protein [Rubrivivax sp.]